MVKLLKSLIAFATIAFFSNVNAMETEITLDREAEIPTIRVQTPTLTARYIELKDIEDITKIAKKSYSEGLPSDPSKWASNLIDRRNGGNYYGCLMIETLENQPLAAIGFGRMPVLNYDPKFTDIIDTFLDFGVIERVDPINGQDYAKENFKRVDNFGLGVMLPMVPTDLLEEQKKDILKLGTDVFQFLKNQEFELPLEKTKPHDLIGLFHPDDSIVEIFKAIGFNKIAKEGFFGFYDKSRVIVHKVL